MMEKIKLMCKTGMAVLASLTFFGVFYPELCMTDEICTGVFLKDVDEEIMSDEEIMNEEEFMNDEEIMNEEEFIFERLEGSRLFYELLEAKPEEIKIKSRIVEIIRSYLERKQEKP